LREYDDAQVDVLDFVKEYSDTSFLILHNKREVNIGTELE